MVHSENKTQKKLGEVSFGWRSSAVTPKPIPRGAHTHANASVTENEHTHTSTSGSTQCTFCAAICGTCDTVSSVRSQFSHSGQINSSQLFSECSPLCRLLSPSFYPRQLGSVHSAIYRAHSKRKTIFQRNWSASIHRCRLRSSPCV